MAWMRCFRFASNRARCSPGGRAASLGRSSLSSLRQLAAAPAWPTALLCRPARRSAFAVEIIGALVVGPHEDIDRVLGPGAAGWEGSCPDLARVGVLVDLRGQHRADNQHARWLLTAVVDPVRARAPCWEGNELALLELPLTVERAQDGLAGDDDQQLLVCVVDVKRETGGARWQLEERSAEPIRAGLPAEPGPPPGERRPVLLFIPMRLEDVGHEAQYATALATTSAIPTLAAHVVLKLSPWVSTDRLAEATPWRRCPAFQRRFIARG